MFREVPVLPVVVPLAGTVVAVLVWRLRRRGLATVPRIAVALALGVYAAGIVANTVFPIFLDKPTSSAPWDAFVVVTPLVDYELADAVMNVAVFVPLGLLLALAAPRAPWSRLLAVAAGCSLAIEVSQYVTARLLGGGHVADVNDLLFNVVGGGLGLMLLRASSRLPLAVRATDRFRWA